MIIQSKPKQRIYLSELQQNIGSSCRALKKHAKFYKNCSTVLFLQPKQANFTKEKLLSKLLAISNFQYFLTKLRTKKCILDDLYHRMGELLTNRLVMEFWLT